MTATRFALVLSMTCTLAACGRVDMPPYGGDKETALVAATVAVDIAKVRALLADGADPNKMVSFSGSYQSGWHLALDQLKPKRPDMIELLRLMLTSGARPDIAWGTGIRQVTEHLSVWEKLRKPRQQGSRDEDPLWMAVQHESPDAVRVLLDAGYDAHHVSSALVTAIESEQDDIVHLLVDAGADVNRDVPPTPLVAAIERRDEALMTYLEEHGAREKP
jgi:hypothetical protein